MVPFQIRLLGKIQIFDDDQTTISLPLKAQELLVYLFIHCNQPHDREKLSAQLWPDIPERRSKKYLRQALWQLQNALTVSDDPQNTIVQLEGSWVQLILGNNLHIDADEFYRAFMQVRDLPATAMSAAQLTAVSRAVKLYRGEFVTGWYHDWCLLERERLQSMFLVMLDKLIDHCLANQQFEHGIEYAMQILRYDKARERSQRRLMRLYYLADNRTAALRQYEQCVVALMQELNVKPSRKTVALYQHIQADKGRDLADLTIPDVLPASAKLPNAASLMDMLQSIQTNIAAMRQEMQSLKQDLNRTKDVSADT